MPYDLKTTRVHSWNVGVQRQIGDNMAVSATYLGNHMMNVWGVVDGQPGHASRRARRRRARARSNPPTGGTQTFAELLDGAARPAPGDHAG